MSNESDIKGKTHKTAEMVAFQAGAVVSRTLVQKSTGTLTLFAFDAGQSLSEHTAPFDAVVVGVEGEADVTISGKPFRVGKDDLLLMPANEPHGLKALTPFKMMLIMIRG
jgi:quercetin dioxygenase-like cupin family protein